MTLAYICGPCYGELSFFPVEPGMLPDPGAQEQAYLWAMVMMTLVGVVYVHARRRMMAHPKGAC